MGWGDFHRFGVHGMCGEGRGVENHGRNLRRGVRRIERGEN